MMVITVLVPGEYTMNEIQLIGIIIGAIAGHVIATMIAGGSDTYIGENVFQVTRLDSRLPG
jgi:hypothetical protein